MTTKGLSLAVVLAGCASSSEPPATVGATSAAPAVSVHGTVQRHGSYCGGAAPTREILEAASRPSPVVGHFLVRAGHENTASPPTAQFTTKPDGSFELAVPPGDYCIVTDAKRTLDVTPSQYADRACLEQVQRSCDATWHVPPAGLDGSLDLTASCFGPCYHGPMPP